jgi:hypothetical protein
MQNLSSFVWSLFGVTGTFALARTLFPRFDARCFYWTVYLRACANHVQDLLLSARKKNTIDIRTMQISPTWLRDVISKTLGPNVSVPELLQVEISKDILEGGLISKMVRVILHWPQSAPDYLPETLVIKTVGSSFGQHLNLMLHGSYREALFYHHFALERKENEKHMKFLPRIYYAEGSMNGGDFIIIMEDLQSSIRCGLMLGNQCWGQKDLPNEVLRPHEYVLEKSFAAIADLHYSHWRDQNLFKLPWLKSCRWLKGMDRGSWELCVLGMEQMWKYIKHEATREGGFGWSSTVVQAMDNAIAKTTWEKYHAAININDPTTPFTLTHGDFHAGNVMWDENHDPPVYIFDWSEVGIGCPYTELAQFMISNATIDVRRKHEKELVRRYYEKLVKLGIDPKVNTFDDCWDRYIAGGIEKWLQMLALLAKYHLKYPAFLQSSHLAWFHDQVSAFIEDHAKNCKRDIILISKYNLFGV